MIQCKINGITIEVEKGTTIIEAFKKSKKDIAHYCWHEGLSVAGVCRLCMVHIEGNPKLQIACNTLVQDGMVISNQTKDVKEAVKWGLEFHLINHPLDCPICDQAGECSLQEQYMKFGQYDPMMGEKKVKKRKVVDLGSKVVLDTERCILCSRCTRFTDEVSKTGELGIFNRGDHSEIGIFKDKPLENNYSLNTVDICPVGALTSKKFRFQQRVWYLKKASSICTGCSTGCNIHIYYNEEGLWRILPKYNKDINQHWMCDKGRETYQHVNKKNRARKALIIQNEQIKKLKTTEALYQLKERWLKDPPFSIELVVTGQYTNEEYKDFLSFYKNQFKKDSVYHWKNNSEHFQSFDGLLFRGDQNPNTKGLLNICKEENLSLKDLSSLENQFKQSKPHTLMVLAPESSLFYPCLKEKIQLFTQVKHLIWMSPQFFSELLRSKTEITLIPTKTYFEKTGTFVNYKGIHQKIKSIGAVVPEAMCLQKITSYFQNPSIKNSEATSLIEKQMKTNYLLNQKGEI